MGIAISRRCKLSFTFRAVRRRIYPNILTTMNGAKIFEILSVAAAQKIPQSVRLPNGCWGINGLNRQRAFVLFSSWLRGHNRLWKLRGKEKRKKNNGNRERKKRKRRKRMEIIVMM